MAFEIIIHYIMRRYNIIISVLDFNNKIHHKHKTKIKIFKLIKIILKSLNK